MKKTNLFKKMTSMLLAAMMLLSAMPMLASAETPNGDYWEELTFLKFDDLTRTDTSTNPMNYHKTINEGLDNEWTYSVQAMSAWNGTLNGNGGVNSAIYLAESWFGDAVTDENSVTTSVRKNEMISTFPVADSGKGLTINRAYTSDGPGRPASQMRGHNLFNPADIAVGDTVRISTWIYPMDVYTWDSSTDSPKDITDETADMQSGVRYWLWSDDAGYNANAPTTSPEGFADECIIGTVPFYQWSKLSIEYDICNYSWQNNTEITSIRTDNAGSTYYPRITYYTGFQVEKLIKAGGTYSIAQDGTVTGSVKAGIENANANHKVIVAAYDGDMFLGCEIKPYTTAGSYDFSITQAGDADKVMAYIWDMTTLEPAITPITLTAAQ